VNDRLSLSSSTSHGSEVIITFLLFCTPLKASTGQKKVCFCPSKIKPIFHSCKNLENNISEHQNYCKTGSRFSAWCYRSRVDQNHDFFSNQEN